MAEDITLQHVSVSFETPFGKVGAVRDVSTVFHAGRISGLIGESGSGKSIMGMSILRLLPNTAATSGCCLLGDEDIYAASISRLRRIRGGLIGLIPQNPGASLDPVMKLKRQFTEALVLHKTKNRKAAEKLAEKLLEDFGFSQPEQILDQYSFQMSGGMNQRLVSALGLACHPGWVIADEPTKGLDAVLRNQVANVLRDIFSRQGSSIILITHDLYLARKICDDIRVLYMGRIVEQNTAEKILEHPRHPYTQGLVGALPSKGMEPIPDPLPERLEHCGCPFYPRCIKALPVCKNTVPEDYPLPDGGIVRCLLYA